MEPLGISDVEEAAYRLVLENPLASAREIEHAAGTSRHQTATILELLERKGLIREASNHPRRYTATPPEAALQPFLAERERELEQARTAIHELGEHFRVRRSGLHPVDWIEVIVGTAAVARRFFQILSSVREEVIGFDKPPYADAAAPAQSHALEIEAIRRGVKFRSLYERDGLAIPGRFGRLEELMAAGEVVRVASTVPLKMIIADRTTALLPLTPESNDTMVEGALVVRHPALLNLLVVLFDLVWATAAPLGSLSASAPPSGAALAATDERILMLLVTGMKLEAIAGHMQIGVSTIERRLKELQDRHHAQSRYHLILLLTRSGWSPGGAAS